MQPYHETITRGETLLVEARFRGENLADATLRVTASPGLSGQAFSLTKILPDTVIIRSEGFFHLGTHTLNLWFDWPSGDITSEVALPMIVTVKADASETEHCP